MEAYKGNSLVSITNSMSVLADFPTQIIILRGTKANCALDARYPGMAERMIWPTGKGEFANLTTALQQALAGDRKVISQIEAHGRAADLQMETVLQDVAMIPHDLRGMQSLFTKDEIQRFKMGDPYTPNMLDIMFWAAARIARYLIAQHPHKPRGPSRRSLVNTFIYRYALANVLYFADWVREGSQLSKRADRLRNDMVDLNFATYATFFNGLMTQDTKLDTIHYELRLVLKKMGARVPAERQQ